MLLRAWQFVRDRQNREIISWLGGGAVVILSSTATLFTYLPNKPTPPTPPVAAQNSGIQSGHDTVINGPVNIGLDEKRIEAVIVGPLRAQAAKLDSLQADLTQLKNQQPNSQTTEVLQREIDLVTTIQRVTQHQIRADQFIDAGKFDQAIAELDEAEQALDRIPSASALVRNQRGYNDKTLAQAYQSKGDDVQTKRYLDKAFNLFEQVENDATASKEARARAIHGIGVIKGLGGDDRAAIAEFDRAIAIVPSSPYVWYDRFLAYTALAERGDVDKAAMRESFNQTREIDVLSPDEIAALKSRLDRYER